MKELTPDETWEECLKMWKWVSSKTQGVDDYDVDELKDEWLIANGYVPSAIYNSCFFCESTEDKNSCDCPGKEVDPDFHCMAISYHYERRPTNFYNELLRLDKIRRKNDSTKGFTILSARRLANRLLRTVRAVFSRQNA